MEVFVAGVQDEVAYVSQTWESSLTQFGIKVHSGINLSFCALTFAEAALLGFQSCELCFYFLFISFLLFSFFPSLHFSFLVLFLLFSLL